MIARGFERALRKLFGEPHPLAEWTQIRQGYASRVLLVGVGRVIDRCRLDGRIEDREVASLHAEARRVMQSVNVVPLSDTILVRAAEPMPTRLGTLDAIHLATAIELVQRLAIPAVLATHDMRLAQAARALGIDVCGV